MAITPADLVGTRFDPSVPDREAQYDTPMGDRRNRPEPSIPHWPTRPDHMQDWGEPMTTQDATVLSRVMGAMEVQVGGDHYKSKGIQPVEYIHANGLDFFEGSAIKYITRWRQKGGTADLDKAIHFLEMLKELEK